MSVINYRTEKDLLLILIVYVSLTSGAKYFRSNPRMSGTLEGSAGNGILETIFETKSLIACGVHCVMRTSCLAFVLDNETSVCQLFDRVLWRYEVSVPQTTALYFENVLVNCPVDYYMYAGFCFKEISTPMTWLDAHVLCQKDGGLLVSISSKERYIVFRAVMAADLPYHIGGYKDADNWIWTTGVNISDGYNAMTTPVSPGSCLSMYYLGIWEWDAIDCNEENKFVCEIHVFEP